MKLFNDQDITYYIKWFMFGFLIFLLIGIVFFFAFRESYDVKLSTNVVEYGKEIRVVDLVKSIGEHKIKDEMIISNNTIQMKGYEVSIDEINTKKLGKQKLNISFSNPDIKSQYVEINVEDTKKPSIQILVDEPYEVKLDYVKDGNFKDLFEVQDNHTDTKKIKVSTTIKEESYSYGDTVHVVIKAYDRSNNKTTRTVELQIKEKEKKEEQATEKPSSSDSSVQSSNQNQSNSNSNNNTSQNQTPIQPPVYKPPVQKPANKQFLFANGYDMNTAPSACQAELFSSGLAGACVPLQDAEGIYYGMELRYY